MGLQELWSQGIHWVVKMNHLFPKLILTLFITILILVCLYLVSEYFDWETTAKVFLILAVVLGMAMCTCILIDVWMV